MSCPVCEAWTQVLRTDGLQRRRECANGHRFNTVEVVVPERATQSDETLRKRRTCISRQPRDERGRLKAKE